MNVSFLFSLLVILGTHLHATQVIPHPVDPQIGENLWGMNYRQSIAIDDILDTTTLCCNCDFFITQDDIDGNGGGFAITQPGNWCLGENIITTAPITISGMQGVVFDLKGRSISSNVKGPFAAIVQITNSPGTVIQNGSIVGQDLGSSLDIRKGISIASSPDSVVSNVRTSFLASVDNPGIIQTSTAFIADSNVEFNNCFATGPFVQGFVLTGDTDTLINCQVIHFSADLVLTIFSNPGLGYWLQGSNHLVENCKSIGGDAQPTSNSAGSTGFFVTANNSILNNCTAIHHFNTTQTSPGIPAGSGFYVTGNNCQINNCTSAYNEAFGIFNSGTGLLVCDNSVFYNGTNYSGTANTNLCNLLCDDYITQDRIPYTISQPGVYCFNGNVQEMAGNAAIIISDNVQKVVINVGDYALERTSVTHNQPLILIGNNCQDIVIQNGLIKSSGNTSINNVAISIANSAYQNITIENMDFEGLDNTIFLGNGGNVIFINDCNFFNGLDTVITCSLVSNLSIDSCNAYNNNGFLSAVTSPNISISGCNIQGGANSFDNHITCTANCNELSIDSTNVAYSQNYGISINTTTNISLSNITASHNINDGILLSGFFAADLDSITTFSNAGRGITLDSGTDVTMGGCLSVQNQGDGFGVINGLITTIQDCSSNTNRNSGFYTIQCIGTIVTGCTAQANALRGFHFDTESIDVSVTDCIAIFNNNAGFLTADTGSITISLLNNRFHACQAQSNGSVPGATDYAMSNSPGVIMIPPLAGVTTCAIATTPDLSIPLEPLAPADFSVYN